MPLAEEYGVRRGKPLPSEHIRDLVRVPSAEWVEDFEKEYEVMVDGNRRGANMGKFIVIRNFVLVAPFPDMILHRQIYEAAHEVEEFKEIIENETILAEAEGIPMLSLKGNPARITDAGYFQLFDGNVMIGASSADFGRADDSRRAGTIEHIHELVGSGIHVSPFDHS
jgi:hypothetical protein